MGTSYTVSVDSQYQTTYDPVAFNISGLEPGSTINADIYLPSSFNSANSYLRYNYLYNDFRPYVDSNGNALYSFNTSDPNNKKVTLTLTDGDAQWDGDGTKNGRIVDPGMPVTDTNPASDITAPTLVSAETSSDGNKVILTFSEALNTVDGATLNDSNGNNLQFMAKCFKFYR